jgi:hypothetical protein
MLLPEVIVQMDLERMHQHELIQERERDDLAALLPREPSKVRLALARALHLLAEHLEAQPNAIEIAYTRPRSLSSR